MAHVVRVYSCHNHRSVDVQLPIQKSAKKKKKNNNKEEKTTNLKLIEENKRREEQREYTCSSRLSRAWGGILIDR